MHQHQTPQWAASSGHAKRNKKYGAAVGSRPDTSVSFVDSYHASPTLIRRPVCRIHHHAFDSRNKLHKHIPSCKHRVYKRPANVTANQTSNQIGDPQLASPSKLSELPTIQTLPLTAFLSRFDLDVPFPPRQGARYRKRLIPTTTTRQRGTRP